MHPHHLGGGPGSLRDGNANIVMEEVKLFHNGDIIYKKPNSFRLFR